MLYQVYSYLRRLGYAVTRAVPPSNEYPAAAPFPTKIAPIQKPVSIWTRIYGFFTWPFVRIAGLFSKPFNWSRPLYISRWLNRNLNYGASNWGYQYLTTLNHT